jgi:hypothetical protein
MKWRIITVVNVLCVVSLYTVPVAEAQPDLTLFPESTSTPPIVDNLSIEDMDPQIDVIVVEDIPVPGTTGQLLFSGEVSWGQTANPSGNIDSIKIDITKATIKNVSGALFVLGPTDPDIVIVSKSHPINWSASMVNGRVQFEGELTSLSGSLSFTAPPQKLTLSLLDSSADFLGTARLSATWLAGTGGIPAGPTVYPWEVKHDTGIKTATTSTGTGLVSAFLFLDEIVIGADEMMDFPNSITADLSSSKAVSAISLRFLAVLALLLAATGGVFIMRRRRALAH